MRTKEVIKMTGKVSVKNGYALYTGEMPENADVVIEDGAKEIVEWAFENQKHLRSVDIPASVERICSLSFADCENLEKVIIRGEKVFYTHHCFRGDKKAVIYGKSGTEVEERAKKFGLPFRDISAL